MEQGQFIIINAFKIERTWQVFSAPISGGNPSYLSADFILHKLKSSSAKRKIYVSHKPVQS